MEQGTRFITYRQLLIILKGSNLPHSYNTLRSYIQKGIVPKPHYFEFKSMRWNIFSEDQVAQILVVLKARKGA